MSLQADDLLAERYRLHSPVDVATPATMVAQRQHPVGVKQTVGRGMCLYLRRSGLL